MARDVVWRIVVCRGAGCPAVFYICGACYRGQAYCGARCRAPAQRQHRRDANPRHQRSPEGRLDHRDRQRVYRAISMCRKRSFATGGRGRLPASAAVPARETTHGTARACCACCCNYPPATGSTGPRGTAGHPAAGPDLLCRDIRRLIHGCLPRRPQKTNPAPSPHPAAQKA